MARFCWYFQKSSHISILIGNRNQNWLDSIFVLFSWLIRFSSLDFIVFRCHALLNSSNMPKKSWLPFRKGSACGNDCMRTMPYVYGRENKNREEFQRYFECCSWYLTRIEVSLSLFCTSLQVCELSRWTRWANYFLVTNIRAVQSQPLKWGKRLNVLADFTRSCIECKHDLSPAFLVKAVDSGNSFLFYLLFSFSTRFFRLVLWQKKNKIGYTRQWWYWIKNDYCGQHNFYQK